VRVGGGGHDDGVERARLEVVAIPAIEALGQRATGRGVDVDDGRELGAGVLADGAGVQRTHRARPHERQAQWSTVAVTRGVPGRHRRWLVPYHWSSVTAPREWLRIKYRFFVGIGFSQGGPSLSRADRPGTRS
jgi:hypothetical protein